MIKIFLFISLLLFGCKDNTTEPEAVIGGTYVYEEAILKITMTFESNYTVYIKTEIYDAAPVYVMQGWSRFDNTLCIDDDCEQVRNITAAGFEWLDAGKWNYWRKL